MGKQNKESLLNAVIPENVKHQLGLWRSVRDIIDEVDVYVKPYKEKLKEISDAIQANLSIEDGEEKSESISVDGAAVAWKNKVVTVKVLDYKGFQNYCTRNNVEFVMRRQVNLGGAKELFALVNSGDIPTPQSAEFQTFDKLTIRKK